MPWHSLLLAFGVSRALILLVAAVSVHFVTPGGHSTVRTDALGLLEHWDASWYLDLAQHGYTHTAEKSNAVFFPLYPGLLRIVASTGLDWRVSGYLISNTALWVACGLLWKLTRRETGDDATATRAVLVMLFSPMAFIFSAIYSESLFLVGAIGALYYARAGRWWIAGAFAFGAALTRAVGVVLIVPLAWEFARQAWERKAKLEARLIRSALPCLLPAVGAACYVGLMKILFGSYMLYFEAQQHWGRRLTFVWDFLAKSDFFLRSPYYQAWFAGAIALAFAQMLIGVALRVRDTYLVLCIGLCVVYFSARLVESVPRYLSVVFPFYLIAAIMLRGRPRLQVAWYAFSAGAQVVALVMFVNGYWIT